MRRLTLLTTLFFIILISIASASTVSYYVYDLPGRTVIAATNNLGSIVANYGYDAFGNISTSTPSSNNNFQYVGEQRDKETNLIYLRNRYYDTKIGRFITKDPIPGIRQNPQTKNPYPYCGNNPVNYIDPLGLDYKNYNFTVTPIGTMAGAIIGALLTGGNPYGIYGGAAIGSLGIIGGVMRDTETGELYPYLGLALSPSAGPTASGSVTMSPYDPTSGWSISGSFAAIISGQAGYTFGKGGSAELGVGWPKGISGSITHAWGPINLPSNEAPFLYDKLNPLSSGTAYAAEMGGPSESLTNLGSSIYGTPSFMAANYGGVSLSKTASLLLDLQEVKGAAYDDKTGQIILIGKQNLSLPQMNLDDLAVAVNSVYSGTDPGVSIDPPLVNNFFPVRYDGKTSQTEFGWIMFESDRIMKTLALGKDNISGQSVSSSVTGYKNLLDRYREANSFPEGESSHRFWFKPKEMKLVKSADGNSMVFDTATMEVLTESKYQDNVIGDPQSEAFALNLTQFYDDYANQFSILRDLKRLGKVVSVVKWIKDNDIPIDLSFISNYLVPAYSTPTNTPATQVSTQWQDGGIIKTLTITGGVTYTKPNEYLTDSSNITDPLKEAAIAQRSSETNFRWNFTSPQNESLTAVAESFARLRKDGNLKFSSTDLSYPADCDFALVFTRYYDSFYDKQSAFGFGWEYRPLQLSGFLNNRLMWGQFH